MSMVKLDRHASKSIRIRQQDFDNILREFNKDSRCAKVYIADDKELEKFIKIKKGKLVFDYVIFNNISMDISLYDVVFTNCVFYNCNFFKTIMEDCNMINNSFELCTFDELVIKRGNFKNLDFIACKFALDSEDKIIDPQTLESICFSRCYGSINLKIECTDIQFEYSNMWVKSFSSIYNLTINGSKIDFNLSGSICGIIKFCYSEITLFSLDDKKFYITGDILADSSKVNIDTFGMEDIDSIDIMRIKSLNSNIFGSEFGYLLQNMDVDMLVNDIIQTGNIGSMHNRTYYDAANDLVRCGEPVWNDSDFSGGSLEKFIMRINEVYPESSDNPRHKKYRKEYMDAIELFKSKRESYAKKKEEYKKILEERKKE